MSQRYSLELTIEQRDNRSRASDQPIDACLRVNGRPVDIPVSIYPYGIEKSARRECELAKVDI